MGLLDIRKREYEDFARRMGVSRQNRTSFNDLWWNPNERFRLTGFGTNINNTVPYFSGSMGSLDFTPRVDRLAPYQAQADNSTLRNTPAPSLKLDNNFDVSNFTLANNPSGFNLYKTGIGALGTGAGLLGTNWLTSLGKSGAEGGAGASAGGFSSALGAGKLSAGAKTGIAVAGSVAGSLAKHFISDGYSSDVGNALADIGGTAGGIVSYFNPVVGALVSFGTGALGGLYNRAFSIKTDEAKLAKAKSNIAYYKNLNFKNKLLDDINPIASLSFQNPYKSGWLKSADDDNQALRDRFSTARDFAVRNQENAVKNIEADTLNKELATSAAYGGPISIGGPIDIVDPSTAIGYSIYTDKYIKDKQKKSSDMTNLFAGAPDIFGFGGGIYTKGANYEQPKDNTRVVGSRVLPIERQQNFSDEQYFWNAGKEYPAGLWKHKDGTFHATGAYGKDIQLTQEEADAIIRNNMLLERQEKLKRAIREKQYANGGYIVGNIYDVDEQEVNRLRSLGYEFTIIG